jgi:hypothetical protein
VTVRRPSREAAELKIYDFIAGVVPELPDWWPLAVLVEDGSEDPRVCAPEKCGWAFALLESDATSYVHQDLSIEWYGTSWTPQAVEEAAASDLWGPG